MKVMSEAFGDARTDMRLPEHVTEPGLLVGWSLSEDERVPTLGFGFGDPSRKPANGWADPVLLEGEGHLITIAPTGAGKGRGCIVTALLRHEGPVIVIDPKGENVAVTARRRRELGHQVIVLDPACICAGPTNAFNPMDLIVADSLDSVDLAAMFAAAMVDAKRDPENTYWYQRAQQLLIGLILHVATLEDPSERTFATVRQMLAAIVGEQGETADERRPLTMQLRQSPHPEARLAASILQMGAAPALGSILSMTQDGVDFLRGPLVAAVTAHTDFALDAVTRGDPLSIYLVLPPHMMESHGRLLRLWIMALTSLLTRRRAKPVRSTLLILDEAAQLGTLPQLRQAITLLRGYGVQTWSFWQDVSQLRLLYPDDWETMINNCRVVQCFGAYNLLAAEAMARITGFGSAHEVLALSEEEMLLQIAGNQAVLTLKPDYLSDPTFAGMFDSNPYHDLEQQVMPPPSGRITLFPRPSRRPPSPDTVNGDPSGRSSMIRRAAVATRAGGGDAQGDRRPDTLLARLLADWGSEG